MKKYVKMTSLLLIILLVLQIIFPIVTNIEFDTSYAANTTCTYGGVTYTYNGTNTLTITGSGTVSNSWKTNSTLNAPKEKITKIVFNSANITGIGSNAFSDCKALTTITYTKHGITSIQSNAFSNCTSLATVTIPDTVTTIGSSAFSGCTKLVTLTIEKGVTSIGTRAFYNAPLTTKITYNAINCTTYNNAFKDKQAAAVAIGTSVQKIPNNFINGNKAVKSITIPKTCTSIGNNAFSGCAALASVSIPNSVTTIGSSAFSGCTKLVTLTIGTGVTSIGTSAFYNAPLTTKITYNAINCTTYNDAFKDKQAATVAIEASVQKIPNNFINGNKAVKSISIPKTCTSIGNNAFQNCTAITTLTFASDSGCKTIGSYAFSGCTGIKTVTIPKTVEKISDHAFYNCSALTTLKLSGSTTDASNNCILYGDYSFYNTGITSVVGIAPDATIGTSAFPSSATVTRATYLGIATPHTGGAASSSLTATREVYLKKGSKIKFSYSCKGCNSVGHDGTKGSINIVLISSSGNETTILKKLNVYKLVEGEINKSIEELGLQEGNYTIKLVFSGYFLGGGCDASAYSRVSGFTVVQPKTYSITYNGNGYTGGSTSSQTKTENISINLRSNGFSKTGHTFVNWNTSANGTGSSYSPGSTYSSNSSVTLYAQWRIHTSTLQIDPNGGSWGDSTEVKKFTKNYNTTMSIPVPTRDGYMFKGWTRTNQYGTLSSTTEDATYTFGTTDKVTDTITANWEKITYELVVEPNGGIWEESSESQTTKLAEEEQKQIKHPIRHGYTFAGWTLQGGEAGSSMNSLTENNATFTMGTAKATLTANWTRNNYELEVNPNGGLWKENTESEESLESKKYTLAYEGTKQIPLPRRNGYEFTGWTLEGEETESTMSSLIKDNAIFTMGYENATLTANWRLITKDITGSITWNDQENKYISRPSKVGVTLNSDEKITEEGALQTPATIETNGSYEFRNLQAKKIKDNTNYHYTVSQQKVLGYETIVNGYDITNNLVLPSYTSEITITPQGNLESEFVKNEQVQIVGIVTASESNREKVGTCKEEVNFAIDNGIEINRDNIKVTYIDKEGNTKEINNFRVEGNSIKVSFESNRENDNTAGDSLKIEIKGTLKEIKQYSNTISYAGYLRDYETGEETNINLGTLTTASKNIRVGKVSIGIKEINEENEITRGSEFEIKKKDTGEVVQRFTTEGKEEIIRKLEPMVEYVVIETKPIAGYTTAEEATFMINEQGEIVIKNGAEKEGNNIIIKDYKTRLQVEIKEEGRSQYVVGSRWQIIRKTEEDGQMVEEVMAEWTSEGKEKQIEKLPIGEYILREVGIGENTGYATIGDIAFRIEDTKELQKLQVEQNISKVQIHIKDEDNKEYSTGSTWQLIDKKGQNVVREWTTNGKVYIAEKVPVGDYILKEVSIGEDTGYVTNAEQEINIVDTKEVQHFEVEQKISKVQIHVKDEDNKEYSTNSTWQLIDKEEQNIVKEWTTNGEAYHAEKLPVGSYILKEISIGENTGYVTNAEQEINIVDNREVQHFEVEQNISKVQIHMKDEDSKEYSTGSTWQLIDKKGQNVVKEWTTNKEAYRTEKVPVGDYILKEVSIGENTGYVTNTEQEINVIDTREEQHFEVEQKISNIQIHIKDEDSKEYSTGSTWQLIDKEEQKIIREWLANGEVYTAEKIAVGTYILKEVSIGENTGYVTNAEQEINIIDTREVQQFEVEQRISNIQIHIKDEDSKEYSANSRWQLMDKEKQSVVREWLANGEVYRAEKLPVGIYILKEVSVGENTGYVTNAEQEINIVDTREMQHFEVEQTISKVQIHMKDEDDKEYSIGSTWQLVDKEENTVREWLANGEAYSIEKLPVGDYILKEVSIGENTGYVTNVDQEIKVTDSREVQHFEVEQTISKVQIHIKDEDHKEYSIGSSWQLIDKEEQNVVREWKTNGEAYHVERLPVGTYILREVSIGENTGYVTNEEQEIEIIDTRDTQHFEVEQTISRIQIHIKDEDSKAYNTGTIWQLIDREENIVREWLANGEAYHAEKLPVGTYILKEISIGENTGYVTNAEQKINVVDIRETQHFEVEQTMSKVRIHLKESETGEYIEGAILQIIQRNEKDGKVEERVIREWSTEKEGKLQEKLPVGDYILREIKLPEHSGYVTIEEMPIKIADTLKEQQIEVKQDVSKIKVEIIDEETNKKIDNVEVEMIEKETGKVIKLKETEEGYVAQRVPIGDYILREKTPDGYKEVKTIEMKVEDTNKVQIKTTENKRLIYDMQVEKELASISIDGQKKMIAKGELQKVEVQASKIKTADIRLEYVIRVNNVGETKATIGTIIDYIPEGFELLSTDWRQEGSKAIYNAEKEELEPGESKEVRIILKWENKESNFGEKKNTAQIKGSTNPYGYEDKTTDNDIGEEIIIFSIKTGSEDKTILIQLVTISLLASIAICFIAGVEIAFLRKKQH